MFATYIFFIIYIFIKSLKTPPQGINTGLRQWLCILAELMNELFCEGFHSLQHLLNIA